MVTPKTKCLTISFFMTWSLSVSMALNSVIICKSSGLDSLIRYFSSISSSLKTRKSLAQYDDLVIPTVFHISPVEYTQNFSLKTLEGNDKTVSRTKALLKTLQG